MSENGDCEIDFTLGIHIDKQYKAELNLINFIDKSKGDINVAIKKVEKIKEKEIELKQKQVQYFAQRIYATYIFKKLLKEFGNEIKAYPDIDIKEKGRDVTGGIMNESLWWIPTVQGKYKNQRFVSQGLWDDENYWNPHHIKLKKENDLRMEHVIDKASSKEYIIKRLVEKKLCNKGFHSDIINDLKSLLFGCIILKNEHSLLPAFGSIDDNLLAKKDVFRKYIGKKLTIKREDYDLEDGYYHLLKLETLNTCFKNTETDKIKDFKIYPDDLKKPMDKDNLAIFLKKKKIECGKPKIKKRDDLNKLVFRFTPKQHDNLCVKNKDNWLVPVFDRELDHYLHCNCHPYNPYEVDCEKKKKHYKFIESVFALDKKIEKKSEEKITDWLAKLPKVDGQFMTKDEIKEQPCNCL